VPTPGRRKSVAVFVRSLNWARPLAVAAIATVMFGACNGSDSVTAPVTPASITISAPSGETTAGGTLQFTATVKDSKGNTIVRTVTWSVAHGGGTINSSGLFTAGDSAGTFANTVVAAIGSVSSAGSSVTVTVGSLATISVTPATITLTTGGTQQFTAVGKDAHGNVVALPSRVWSVAAAGGTIDTSGLFTAGTTAGTFTNTVVATSGSASGTASVTVGGGPVASIVITLDTTTVANGGTHQYIVTGLDAHGNVVPVVPAPTWSVVAGGGTIDPATGLFTAGTVAGQFVNTIHVVSGTLSASMTVTIAAGPLATITVAPASPSLAINATQQFTAVGKDANANVVAITPVWSVAAGGGTINSASGLFTAGATGGTFTNTVVATVGAVSGTTSVTVTGGVLASITVTPSTVSLSTGGTQAYTAVGHDAGNNVVAITPTWSVAAGGGTINASTGMFTAGTTAGTFTNTVTATSGAITGTATVTVVAGPLANLTITPPSASLAVTATQQFTVVGTDANNNVVAVTPTWNVLQGGGTINSSTGLFTAGTVTGTFTNTVVVTVGSLAQVATVTVTAGPVATITVTPTNPSVTVNSNVTFTAVGKDVYGNVTTIHPSWAVSTPNAGTIGQSGVMHASTTPGTYTNAVSATVGLVVGTASVTVVP
jgi:hypothetical protein